MKKIALLLALAASACGALSANAPLSPQDLKDLYKYLVVRDQINHPVIQKQIKKDSSGKKKQAVLEKIAKKLQAMPVISDKQLLKKAKKAYNLHIGYNSNIAPRYGDMKSTLTQLAGIGTSYAGWRFGIPKFISYIQKRNSSSGVKETLGLSGGVVGATGLGALALNMKMESLERKLLAELISENPSASRISTLSKAITALGYIKQYLIGVSMSSGIFSVDFGARIASHKYAQSKLNSSQGS